MIQPCVFISVSRADPEILMSFTVETLFQVETRFTAHFQYNTLSKQCVQKMRFNLSTVRFSLVYFVSELLLNPSLHLRETS